MEVQKEEPTNESEKELFSREEKKGDRKATEAQQVLCAVRKDLKGWLVHLFSLGLEQID